MAKVVTKTIDKTRKTAKVVPIKEIEKIDAHNLADHAMLITLSLSAWRGKTSDRQACSEIATSHDAQEDALNVVKKLMPKGALDGVNSVISRARVEHHRRTLPWLAGGVGILSSIGFLPYAEKFRELKAMLKIEKDSLRVQYTGFKDQAKKDLGTLYRESDYPSIDELMDKIDIQTRVMPIPSGQDFRVQISDAVRQQIQHEIEEQVRLQVTEATKEPYRRVAQLAARMVERLNAYTVTDEGKKLNVFKDTLVTNVRDLVELLPSLNLTNDTDLTQLTELLKTELLQYQPETLRESAMARQQTAESAQKILDHVQAYI